jgi:hypothetical protein
MVEVGSTAAPGFESDEVCDERDFQRVAEVMRRMG